MAKLKSISGWGNYPKKKSYNKVVSSQEEIHPFLKHKSPFVVRGNARSYGDSAIHDQSLTTTGMSQIESLTDEGVLIAQAGVLFSEVLEFIVPKGFFLPVTPGTKFVSLGGAIAADIHGKNHHVDGNISNFIQWIDLLVATGETKRCSPEENSDLFWASCGGMGLTGIILRAALVLKPIETSYIKQRSLKSGSLAETIELIRKHESYTYSVAWIDCLKKGKHLGRSILLLGEHAKENEINSKQAKNKLAIHKTGKLSVPFNFPSFVLNKLSVKAFNWLYYNKVTKRDKTSVLHYDPYFYPLDGIYKWNRIYGRRGFIQYQFVLPTNVSNAGMQQIVETIAKSGLASFLSVLKMFGPEREHNYIAFPMEGLNLALDIKMGGKTLELMDALDKMVSDLGGRVYLAKDARMKTAFLDSSYPEINKFKTLVDKYNPEGVFSSDQAKRLMLIEQNKNADKSFFMKNILILGANSDIAKATAKKFDSIGFSLTLASRNTSQLKDFAGQLSKPPTILEFDALQFESHKTFYQGLEHKPDLVVCAFGTLPDEEKALNKLDDMLTAINSNYTGAVSILNVIAADFKKRKEGSIIGISSVAGDRGRSSNYHYGSAKAGFTAYLSGLRGLLRNDGVHVGTIKPGFVRTKMIEGLETPGPLTASPDQVANAIYKSYKKRRSIIYVKPVWRPVMWIIKHIPGFIFKRLSI